MMRITLFDAGKRFNRDWIFRHLSFKFSPGNSYAITGPNGSGKSTLLQLLSGSMEISEGEVRWELNDKVESQNANSSDRSTAEIDKEKVYQYIAIAAPYLEVVEEMTAIEFLDFHRQFKNLLPGLSTAEIISIVDLDKAAHKQIRYYSSGMKQRIKLAQAIFSDVPLLLLDEPCTNLDENGYRLYHQLIEKYCVRKTIIVSSNDVNEYSFCKERISITDFK